MLDNNHGRGAFNRDGAPQYWIDAMCPVHCPINVEDEDSLLSVLTEDDDPHD